MNIDEKYSELVNYVLHMNNEATNLATYGLVRDEFYKEGLLTAYEGILMKIEKLGENNSIKSAF